MTFDLINRYVNVGRLSKEKNTSSYFYVIEECFAKENILEKAAQNEGIHFKNCCQIQFPINTGNISPTTTDGKGERRVGVLGPAPHSNFLRGG